MTGQITVTLLATLLGCVGTYLIVVLLRQRPGPALGLLEQRLREEFIVTMRNGETFRGLLEAEDTRWVLLRQVDALTQDVDGTAKHTPVDGELVLPRDQIAYLQRP